MDYYKLAEEEIKSIEVLQTAGQYRHVITHCCMCIEYLLKTKLVQINPASDVLYGHDIINIFKEVQERYTSSKNLISIVRFCRKYLNDSRYPASGTAAYTKKFAEDFIRYVTEIKNYIDNECIATEDDLLDKYKK